MTGHAGTLLTLVNTWMVFIPSGTKDYFWFDQSEFAALGRCGESLAPFSLVQ